jgi:hypothetical protein
VEVVNDKPTFFKPYSPIVTEQCRRYATLLEKGIIERKIFLTQTNLSVKPGGTSQPQKPVFSQQIR